MCEVSSGIVCFRNTKIPKAVLKRGDLGGPLLGRCVAGPVCAVLQEGICRQGASVVAFSRQCPSPGPKVWSIPWSTPVERLQYGSLPWM